MPPSADEAGKQEFLANFDPVFAEASSTRKKSPKGKKKKRKDESPAEEDTTKAGKGGDGPEPGLDKKLTQPPSSILAQLHKAQAFQSSPPEIPPAAPLPLQRNISSELFEGFDAAPTLPPPTTTSAQDTTKDWASNIPYGRSPPDIRSNYGQSPPRTNGVSIAGSPPTGGHHHGPEILQGGFTAHASPPISPRAAFRQPAKRSTDYHGFRDQLGSSPNQNNKRAPSVYSQQTQFTQHPLPHRPQAHFYGAPEIDFGVGRQGTLSRPAREGMCCKFDKLPTNGKEVSGRSESVLLLGFEFGLDVFHIDKKRFDRLGRLAGLRGSVIAAKVLPSTGSRGDLRDGHPLVAVIVHGPHYSDGGSGEPNADFDEFDPSGSMVQALQTAETDFSLYQTTVEVYSLRDGMHVQTLFRSPTVEVESKPYGPPIVPPPVGDLAIQAKGRFIVVSSGQSGEVYNFESVWDEANRAKSFRCIGKIWTKTNKRASSRSVSMSSASDSGESGLHDASAIELRQLPRANLSLSSRWLAFVPPPSSAQNTLHGTVATPGSGAKVHGVSSHTSPAEPSVTCQLDTPDAESYLNKAVRDASQTFIKGARWVGDQGVQAWNSYWKPEQGPQTGSPPPIIPAQNPQFFPPTHAQDSKIKTVRSQTSLVSILDLEKLSKSQNQKAAVALQPLATFSLPNGCSLVSFSPDGLKLLTASSKGDVQQVWDLMRMIHSETSRFVDQNPVPRGPTVREVARFPRMTEATIIDVVWTEPRGARLAILTGNGTAHIFDLPPKAFLWPPPRQINQSNTSPSTASEKDEAALRPQTTSSSLSSAFNILSSTTTSTIAAVRGRRPGSATTFPTSFGGFAGAGAQSGKAVAAGVNRSVSAAAVGAYDTLRHLGENRITLPASATETVSPGSIHWLDGANFAITAGGLVRIYGISRSSSSSNDGAKGKRRRPSVLAGKPAEFTIPRDSAVALDSHHNRHSAAPDEAAAIPPLSSGSSFWRSTTTPANTNTNLNPNLHSAAALHAKTEIDAHPLSHAEMDTSAAYQPFHTDRRVNFFVYDFSSPASPSASTAVSDPHHLHPPPPPPSGTTPTTIPTTSTWLFGQPIPASKVSSGNVNVGLRDGEGDDGGGDENDNDEEGDDDGNDARRRENTLGEEGEGEGGGIVVTTSRVRGRKRGKVKGDVRSGDEGAGLRGGEGEGEGEGEIFEDDVQWVDFTEERV